MVVVLSPIVQAADALNANQALADKEPIMASLNLKAMPFDDVATVLQREMVAHLSTDDDSGTKVTQPNRILSVSKLEEISAVLPMITELGKDKHNILKLVFLLCLLKNKRFDFHHRHMLFFHQTMQPSFIFSPSYLCLYIVISPW